MRLLKMLFAISPWQLGWAIVTGAITGLSTAGLIALVRIAITDLDRSQIDSIVIFVCLSIVLLVSMTISQAQLARLVQILTAKLRIDLSQQILATPLQHLERLGASKLFTTLTEDINTIARAAYFISNLFISIAMLISCLLYLAWLSPFVFPILLVSIAIGIVSQQFLSRRGYKFLKLARDEGDRLFGHLKSIVFGIKELQLHSPRREAFLATELQASVDRSYRYQVGATDRFALSSSWGVLVLFGAIGLIVFLLPLFSQINRDTLSGYALVLSFMFTPIRIILNNLPEVTRADIALNKIAELGLSLTDRQLTSTFDPVLPTPTFAKLNLVNVSHTYQDRADGSEFCLGPVDLSISSGELIFIIGGNGSGKSTLAKLLTGLYAPDSGFIYCDGVEINDRNRDWYRQHFTAIFADFYLFDRFLGLEHTNLKNNSQSYLQQLQLDRQVKIDDDRLSTIDLSQGQKKRLALLTAYLENRPIYLFDEWAADQDPQFRNIFYREILPALKQAGKTAIVISHDDRYFHIADRLIKLDYGKIEFDRRS